eukprot:TRINITY_DN16787_c0_g1_i1.p1 TRINITY_DN16787_c0_g1~~TRINITY_DN16787_c0_g1_i1.p1  ORF type:complete len:238 (-),score=26.41 TRINITY_DN16787_c0_g1_i1:57-770(-)
MSSQNVVFEDPGSDPVAMAFEIRQEPVNDSTLAAYGSISIAFETNVIMDVAQATPASAGSPGLASSFVLKERELLSPLVKDYDALPGAGTPSSWASDFDMSRWLMLAAYSSGPDPCGRGLDPCRHLVGGALVAFDTASVDMLEGRRDLAVLWDIRIATRWRGRGIGASLFRAAESWASEHGCHELKVETQNNNPAACKFYARQGCNLSAVNHGAYAELPDEVQLSWRKPLASCQIEH